MKKPVKITLISIGSLIGLVLLAAAVLVWVVLTPKRLTPIVNKAAASFVTCPTKIGSVELTFFSTFPKVSLRVDDVLLLNPMKGAPSDTLLRVERLNAAVNIRKLLKEDELEVKSLHLKNGDALLYTDAEGRQNFDVLAPSDTLDTTASEFPFEWISAKKLNLEHLNVTYVDEASHLNLHLDDFNTRADAELSEESFDGQLKADIGRIMFHLADSSRMDAALGDVRLRFKGEMKENAADGVVHLTVPALTFAMDSLRYADSAALDIKIPVKYDMVQRRLQLDKAEVGLDNLLLTLDGSVQAEDTSFSAFDCAVDFALRTVEVPELLPWVDRFAPGVLEGMRVNGFLTLDGTVKGVYADSLMPEIIANLLLKQGKFEDQELLPNSVKNIVIDARALLDLNRQSRSNVEVHNFAAETGKSKVQLQGKITDLLDKLCCDLLLTGKVNLPDVEPFLPDSLPLTMRGTMQPNLKVKFNLDDLQQVALQRMQAKGTLAFKSLDADYDSLQLRSDALTLGIQLPSPNQKTNKKFNELMQAKVTGGGLKVSMSNGMNASLDNPDLLVGLSDFMDTTKLLSLACDFDISSLHAVMDTLDAGISHPKGHVTMTPSKKDASSPAFTVDYSQTAMAVRMGSFLKTVTQGMSVTGNAVYDSTPGNLLEQWSPHLNFRLSKATVGMDMFKDEVSIPEVSFALTPSTLDLKSGRFGLGETELNLSGKVLHLSEFLNDEAMLKADLDLVSDYIDVNYLMDFFSGMNLGADSLAEPEPEPDPSEAMPFMVPLGMDVTLNTKATKLLVGETIVEDLGGTVTVKDGVLVLEEMGFTCDAARMQLTAIYKSPRMNHLFAYVDFHLMDIQIADLIEMIPDIDTIVPMLKSFAGRAEFHFAAQTNLNANYDIKYSTLRAAASISGQDLVVLDNETFSTIAKYLRFKKQTENKVDSISVEMTVFQKNVDLYPFLVSMDKYQAIVAGHYVINQNYDCHLSLVESPLPARLGLNVYGSPEKMQYKLEKPQYATLFKPEKRNVVEQETMKLKQMITQSLKANVK